MPVDNTAQPIESFKKKRNKKKVIITVSAAVISLVLIIGCFVLYCYFTPDIRITVSKPVDPNAESYIQTPMVILGTKLGMPLPSKTAAHNEEFWQANNAVITKFYEEYKQPVQIDTTVRIVDGQTLVAYSGTVTDEAGELSEFYQQLVFDFVLTEKIS